MKLTKKELSCCYKTSLYDKYVANNINSAKRYVVGGINNYKGKSGVTIEQLNELDSIVTELNTNKTNSGQTASYTWYNCLYDQERSAHLCYKDELWMFFERP